MTAIFWLVSRLPLTWAQSIGDWVGAFIAWLPGLYGTRLKENYRCAYPDATAINFRAAARSAGRMMMEMPYFWMRRDALESLHISPATYPQTVSRLLERGKGVILLSPHLGGYELLGPLFAQHAKCTVLFKPPRHEFFRTWVERMRAGRNLAMAPANYRGVRMLVKALRRGEIVGILPDQCPPAGEGEWTPFFGKPAYTMTLVKKLQAQTGASIVLVMAERLSRRSHYRIHVEPLATPALQESGLDPLDMNEHMERMIALAPDQYLWGYHRYKSPGGIPKEASALHDSNVHQRRGGS